LTIICLILRKVAVVLKLLIDFQFMNKLSQRELKEKIFFDSVAKKYDKNYGYNLPFTKYKISKKIDKFISLIEKFSYLKKADKLNLLEVGCGTGEYTWRVAKKLKTDRILGLDISKNVLDLAKIKCNKYKNVSFTRQSIYKTTFKNNTFDVIYCFYTLHHVDNRKFFEEISRILKPGGLLFVCEPNILNPLVFLIKSNKFIKKIVGDSPNEWGVNPLIVNRYSSDLKMLDINYSEYIIPVLFLPDKFLKIIDKITNLVSHIPIFKMLGGSIQILFIKR